MASIANLSLQAISPSMLGMNIYMYARMHTCRAHTIPFLVGLKVVSASLVEVLGLLDQVLSDEVSTPLHHLVKEHFVQGEVKPVRLQVMVLAPVHVADEDEVWVDLARRLNGGRPKELSVQTEMVARNALFAQVLAPSLLEHVWTLQHSHITSNPIAHACHVRQQPAHLLTHGAGGVVELYCVLPTVKVRVLAVGKDPRSTLAHLVCVSE